MSFDALKAEMREREKKKNKGIAFPKCSVCCVPAGAVHLENCPIPAAVERAMELERIFLDRFRQRIGDARSVAEVELMAFNAAEELADTLRGRVRQRERERIQKERATYER